VNDNNPVWRDGLAVVAEEARGLMDNGELAKGDDGGVTYTDYPSEAYAQLFAFLSLVEPDEAVRNDNARRARALLMHVIDKVKQGPAEDEAFRQPDFATNDRSRYSGEAFALTVDWIYPYLSEEDKETIRSVFLRWAQEIETTGYHHPEPTGVVNESVLTDNESQVRWAVNNYVAAGARNLTLMALALDDADDPGGELHKVVERSTGSWLYIIDRSLRTAAAGGLSAEGFEYAPQSMAYVAQTLLALHTSSESDNRGPQASFGGNPFWEELLAAFAHSLTPGTIEDESFGGRSHQPAWYGDGQDYAIQDPIPLFAPIGLGGTAVGRPDWLSAAKFFQREMAPGGSEAFADRYGDPSTPRDAILYFLLFGGDEPAPADYRQALPLVHFAPGAGRILARTSWDDSAAYFTYILGWKEIDHQHSDGNSFEFYRDGEWLTKEHTGYDLGTSDFHNTMAIENGRPEYYEDQVRAEIWKRGSQWASSTVGDPSIVAHSSGGGYVYATGDATALYNSDHENVHDVMHASRSILWLQPDHVVVYDRTQSAVDNRFARFWVQTPNEPRIDGTAAVASTDRGQQLSITSLLPTGSKLSSDDGGATVEENGANGDPMKFRLAIEAPPGRDNRFLTVLQGADPAALLDNPTLVRSNDGTEFEGAAVAGTLVLFTKSPSDEFGGVSFVRPGGVTRTFVTGLEPGGMYSVSASGQSVTITTGGTTRAEDGGVLVIG
jgi:hypothetical protein